MTPVVVEFRVTLTGPDYYLFLLSFFFFYGSHIPGHEVDIVDVEPYTDDGMSQGGRRDHRRLVIGKEMAQPPLRLIHERGTS